MMRRKLMIVLLSVGTVGGFASGFSSMRCRAHARRAEFERHVASVCVDAARRADTERAGGSAALQAPAPVRAW
ncbi:hypothetical protein [Chondromyces apiculatus]|uniref:Uncharacterized protein n=1 Tax=Chondromyces apiculatus DSM 436 TaxID=1192034 RepID=A0A017SXK0_9BACT|nr:hypothetical protein [Chondromyces apiculatus]EYF01683.1 Hypothetical protein CAP_7888 [Chondromyces apiculatus DSM 436]